MPVAHEGLEKEFGYISKPFEVKHIRGRWMLDNRT